MSFQNACDRFTFTEVLVQPAVAPASTAAEGAAPAPAAAVDGLLDAAAVGAYIVNNHPSFDACNYGSPRLGQLVRSLDIVDVKQVPSTDGSEHPYVRLKAATPRRP